MTNMTGRYKVLSNQRTQLVVDGRTGRCLGGVGSNFYRIYVFPLYTPAGLTVIREFPFDHPFHNGLYVGQHPVIVAGRTGNFWAAPPLRGKDDHLGAHIGRLEVASEPETSPYEEGVRFVFRAVWLDENDRPMLNEVRTVDLRSAEDATICDVASEKAARYGDVEYPQTKFGSIGIRVEPRLLPSAGGVIRADSGRMGTAETVHERDSDFVAYENELSGSGRFGVFMTALDPGRRGPWFIRDYGIALYNPTWRETIRTPQGESWTVALRVVAYDGPLDDERARRWCRTGAAEGDRPRPVRKGQNGLS